MSVDVARLVFEIDSTAAMPAEKHLDDLIVKGERLEATAKRVKSATDQMNAGHLGAVGAAQRAAQATMGLAQAQGVVEKATLAADRSVERSAQQALAFRIRIAKQRADEEARAAKVAEAAQLAADREVERSAAQVLAFRQRMARQRASEEAAAAKASARAQIAADRELDAQIAAAMRGQIGMNAAMVGGTRSAKGLNLAVLDLSRQFADVGVTAAMGMSPLMILIQQGPQIADRLALMKQQGIGLGAALKGLAVGIGLVRTTLPAAIAQAVEMATAEQAAAAAALESAAADRVAATSAVNLAKTRQAQAATALEAAAAEEALAAATAGQVAANTAAGAAATRLAAANEAVTATAGRAAAAEGLALAPLGAILAALAVIATVVGGTLLLAARALNKENGDLTKGLGLTADQLEKVKNKGVTMGDVVVGTFNYIAKAVGPILKPVADFFTWLFDSITTGAVKVVKNLVGGFIGAYDAIKATWSLLPAALGDVTVSTVNSVLSVIEKMINFATDRLNDLIGTANKAAKAVGLDAQLPTLNRVAVPRLDNPNAGAAARVATVGAEAFAAGYAKGDKLVEGVLRGLGESIVDAAIKRIKKEAGKGPKAAGAVRDQTDERSAQIDALLAQARADELQAQIALTKDIQQRADLEKQVLAEEFAKKQANIARQAANIEDDKGLTQAKKLELLAQLKVVEDLEKKTAGLRARAIDDAASDALAKQTIDIANARRDGEASILQSQLALATTAKQRGEIEAKLLTLADERAKAELEGVIAAKTSTATQIATAKAQLDALKATGAARDAAQQRKTAVAGAEEIIDELSQIDALANQAGQSLENAFGSAGKAASSLLSTLTRFRVQMAQINKDEISGDKTAAQAARQRAAVQVQTYGDITGAAKNFFKEGSRGYKALEIAETAFRVIEFANSVKSVFLKSAETAATVTGAAAEAGAVVGAETAKTAATTAGAAIRTPLKVAEGAASMFAALGPLAFPVVAAMLAVMAGLGFSKGGGGGSAPSVSETRQARQGTGSVLGDASAKSDSIAKSLEIVASNTNHDLEYSNSMLRALRSIDANIGALTAQLAKELNVGGSLDTSGLGLGTTTSGPGLLNRILNPISNLLPGLFGTKSTTTLLDQGLDLGNQSLGSILSGGLNASTYQTTETTKKKKFFGIVYSNKTSQNTAYDSLDGGAEAELQRVVSSLRDGVLAAASAIGVEGAEATLNAFQVNIGKISFTGKTGTEIQAELEAVFSKLGDDMAAAAVPGLSAMQKAGEGAFETLARVAREYQVVDVALQSIGKTFGSVGVASIQARDDLVQLFGTLDDFAAATQAFADDFLTEAERMAPIQKAVQDELARLGVTGVNTKDQFKQLVLAQDLTTESGREMYAALLAVGPAFAKVSDYISQGSKNIQEARDALSKAYEREADALGGVIDRFRQFSESLSQFRESLYTGPAAGLSPEAQYLATKAKFEDVSSRAKLGDEKALGDLQNVSQAYLDASRQYYASSGRYFQDLADVRAAVEASEATATRTADNAEAQLDALKASVSGLIQIDEDVISVHDAIVNLTALLAAQQAGANATPFMPASATGQPTVTGAAPANDNASATYTPVVNPYQVYEGGGSTTVNPNFDPIMGGDQSNLFAGGAYGGGQPQLQFFASGGAFGRGGVVSRPSSFQTGKGPAVAGESGPEAVLPLANVNGSLGVRSAGGSDPELKALLTRLIALAEEGNDIARAAAEAIIRGDETSTAKLARVLEDATTGARLANGGLAA